MKRFLSLVVLLVLFCGISPARADVPRPFPPLPDDPIPGPWDPIPLPTDPVGPDLPK